MAFSASYQFKLIDDFSKHAANIAKSASTMVKAFKALDATKSGLSKIANVKLTGLSSEFKKVNSSVTKNITAIGAYKKQLNSIPKHITTKITQQVVAAKGGASSVAASTVANGANPSKFKKNYRNIAGAAHEASMTVGAAGVAGAAVIGSSLAESISRETSFTAVQKAGDFTSKSQEMAFKAKLAMIGNEVPVAVQELHELAAEALKAGLSVEDVGASLKDTAKIATAFDMSAGEAGHVITGTRKFFDMTRDQTNSYADYVNQLDKTYESTASNTVDIVNNRIGGIIKTLGGSAKESAAIASLIEEAKTLGRGHTAVDSSMTRIATGFSTMSDGDYTSLLQKGINPLDLTKMLKETQNPAKVLLHALELIKSKGTEGVSVAKQLFGQEASSEIVQMSVKSKEFADMLKLIGDEAKYAGGVQAEFDIKLDSVRAQSEITANSLKTLQDTLAVGLLPTIKFINPQLRNLANGLVKFTQEHPNVTAIALAMGAVFTATGLAVGAIGAAAWLVTPLFNLAGAIWGVEAALGGAKLAAITLGTTLGSLIWPAALLTGGLAFIHILDEALQKSAVLMSEKTRVSSNGTLVTDTTFGSDLPWLQKYTTTSSDKVARNMPYNKSEVTINLKGNTQAIQSVTSKGTQPVKVMKTGKPVVGTK